MKKSVTTLYTWVFLIGLLFLIGWCTRFCSTPKVLQIVSIDLEPYVIDTLSHPEGDYYSNYIRIRFNSLKDIKLDFDQSEMNELDHFGIDFKVRFKDGTTIESGFPLWGIQRGNDLIIDGADLRKKWHTSEEWDALNNLSVETVQSIDVKVYEDDGYDDPTITTKHFTRFDTISKDEAFDYFYTDRH